MRSAAPDAASSGSTALLAVVRAARAAAQPARPQRRPGWPRPGCGTGRLTNLAHLDFLTDRVAVPDTAAHSTYRLAAEQRPEVGVIWVYADSRAGGTFERVGGGAYDAPDQHLGPGRLRRRRHRPRRRRLPAPVAGDRRRSTRKQQAYQQLRGADLPADADRPARRRGRAVDAAGRHPDTRSPTPPDSPNPADSGASYWLARTLWALRRGLRRLPATATRRSPPSWPTAWSWRVHGAATATC